MPENGPHVSLKDHFETQIRWVDRYFENRIANLHREAEKAERELNKRLKEDLTVHSEAMEKRIRILENAKHYGEGRIAVISIVISAVVAFTFSSIFGG